MVSLNVENIGDLAIVECEGRGVQSEAAFKLAMPSLPTAMLATFGLS